MRRRSTQLRWARRCYRYRPLRRPASWRVRRRGCPGRQSCPRPERPRHRTPARQLPERRRCGALRSRPGRGRPPAGPCCTRRTVWEAPRRRSPPRPPPAPGPPSSGASRDRPRPRRECRRQPGAGEHTALPARFPAWARSRRLGSGLPAGTPGCSRGRFPGSASIRHRQTHAALSSSARETRTVPGSSATPSSRWV